jgi:hypothetical protein
MRRLLLAASLAAVCAFPAAAQQNPAADIAVSDMETVIAALQQRKGDRNSAQAALFLTLLKQIGRPAAHDNGKPRLDYKVEIAQNGGILVNGIDIVPLINTAAKFSPKK